MIPHQDLFLISARCTVALIEEILTAQLSSSHHVHHSAQSPVAEDPKLKTAVGTMNHEANNLRRQSRVLTFLDLSPVDSHIATSNIWQRRPKGNGKEIDGYICSLGAK